MKEIKRTVIHVYLTDEQKNEIKKFSGQQSLSEYLLMKGLDLGDSNSNKLIDREALLLLGEIKQQFLDLSEQIDSYPEIDRTEILENLNDAIKEVKEIGQKVIDISA